jgi:hypothetical protein
VTLPSTVPSALQITRVDAQGSHVVEFNLSVVHYDDGLVKVEQGQRQMIYNLRSLAVVRVEIES